MPLPSPVEPQTGSPAPDPSPLPRPDSRTGAGYLFGVPLGDLGWFATLLMSLASGFAAFFAATFVGIMSLLIYNTVLHRTADYAISYRLVGLPVGLLVLVATTLYLGSLWIRRKVRRG